jgi:hypothetical protein
MEFFKTYDFSIPSYATFACCAVKVGLVSGVCVSNLSILLPCVVVPMMVQLLGPLQCGVLAYVQSIVACSSAAEAGMFGAWMWFGFTLPCFHHDTWTSRSVKGTVLSQSVEAVGSVLFSVAIFALPRFLDGVWVILTH